MSQKTILFVNGINDDAKIKVSAIKKDGSHSFVYNGGTNIYKYITHADIQKKMLILDANNSQEIQLRQVDIIFNEISDADTHKVSLNKLSNIYKLLPKKTKVLNHPRNILKTTRDNIYTLLKDIPKLHVPKTIKVRSKSPNEVHQTIKNESLDYPVIFRQAGDHGGISTVLLQNDKELLHAFALDGREFYLTQYIECLRNNCYTKYRLVVINGVVYLRHMIYAKTWMVHAENQVHNSDMKKNSSKEFNTHIKPRIQLTINKIYNILKLDYFGIDCDIDENMNMTIFEINANMNVFFDSEESIFSDHIEEMKQALHTMLLSK